MTAGILSSLLLLSSSLQAEDGHLGTPKTTLLPSPVVPGDLLSPTTFESPSGSQLSWFPGRTTLFVVVGYWCDTWKIQLPRVDRVRSQIKRLPIDVRVVSIDGRWTELGEKRGSPPDFVDRRSIWSASLGLDRVPYSVVVDPTGTVTWAKFGVARSDEMVAAVKIAERNVRESSSIALTFDDFPSRGDEKLLDVLAAEDIQATFFVIGEKLSTYPDLVRRAIQDGHRLEIHGWKHDPKLVDTLRCASKLRKDFRVEPSFVRHPGSDVIYEIGGKKIETRTTNPYDYRRPGPGEIARRILNHVRRDGVILLHSGVDQTVLALPKVIQNLKRLNYRFSLLS